MPEPCTSNDCELERVDLRNDIARLKRGEFTPEEVQEFCHNLPKTTSREDFAKGCIAYQAKLYGDRVDGGNTLDADGAAVVGAEAEDLRRELEALIKRGEDEVRIDDLSALLDAVDARDSLAYLENKQQRKTP